MKQTIPGVFDLWLPAQSAAPLVFDSPHSGSHYPADFDTIAPESRLRRAEDMFVDNLFDAAPSLGAALLTALFPRNYIDPNRALADLDRRLVAGDWPGELRMTEQSRLGHGLIWGLCPADIPMYNRKLTVAENKARIQGYYRRYHRALRDAMEHMIDRFGYVWHVNCHSMPAVSAPMMGRPGKARRRADFVLGDRDGTSSNPAFTALVRETLEGMGYAVAVNDPYKGVELVRAYSDPEAGRHSLQIEINRALYMDEDEFRPSADFARLKTDIDSLVAAICNYTAAQVMPRAAE